MTINEMMEALRQPLPHKLISQKDTGKRGFVADYVNITDCKDELDRRIGAGNWQVEIARTDCLPDTYVMVIRLHLVGSDRTVYQDGTGIEYLEGNHYGDVASNSYARAFKRACESFGFMRELWRGTDDPSNNIPQKSATNKQPQHQQQSTHEIPLGDDAMAKSVDQLATPKQLAAIRAICKGKGVEVDSAIGEILKTTCQLEELNRRAASSLISELNNY